MLITNSQLVVDNTIKPKSDYFDELVERNLLTNLTDMAKILGIKQKIFIEMILNGNYDK